MNWKPSALNFLYISHHPDSHFANAYGFSGEEDYLQHKQGLGNLVLLDGNINSACNNRTVEAKMTTPNL